MNCVPKICSKPTKKRAPPGIGEMAADLAKLSLWLATLARDHEFTFLNHALRHGDSLAGLSARQIAAFHYEPKPMQTFLENDLRERIARAAA